MHLTRRRALQTASAALLALRAKRGAAAPQYLSPLGPKVEPTAKGKFQPTWESLQQYQTPDWYRDAKFGIWAHWGAQCQPEYGDWYARNMYIEGSEDYKFHLQNYGHPSKFGFKDVIHQWKAENWDPDHLVGLYKAAGAQYFVALANHHDNFDNFDSKYQLWNSVRQGPKKDLIGGWSRAARSHGLKFGVSIHAAHAWMWYEVAQGADKSGPLAGVPYDGKLTKADGKGLWWEGLDPQDLYAQAHTPGQIHRDFQIVGLAHRHAGQHPRRGLLRAFLQPHCRLNQQIPPRPRLLRRHRAAALPHQRRRPAPGRPLLQLQHEAARRPARSGAQRQGAQRTAAQMHGLGHRARPSSVIEPEVWQTDTCIGNWHYDRKVLERHRYKTAATVVRTLADIVSKNGNLLLNIPVKGDGTLDTDEQAIVAGITHWMEINRECIFGTRPWKVFGEGPASQAAPLRAQGFNEGRGKPVTADDVRFTTRNGNVYMIQLGVPTQELKVQSLGIAARQLDRPIENITLLGSDEKLDWKQAESLTIAAPKSAPSPEALVYKIVPKT